jgi:hypothetical protein
VKDVKVIPLLGNRRKKNRAGGAKSQQAQPWFVPFWTGPSLDANGLSQDRGDAAGRMAAPKWRPIPLCAAVAREQAKRERRIEYLRKNSPLLIINESADGGAAKSKL